MQATQLGPYRLLSALGSGGMGTVHAAEAVTGVQAGQRVALKIVHPHLLGSPGFFKRFLREAELGRKVTHENVVRTFDVDAAEVDDRVIHYMVMEYVEGRTLRELLRDLKTVPEALVREIGRQVAAGLTAIHGAGIVHRDLKPENVLITGDHRVRIMDLGVARLVEQSVALTREGEFAGSLLYAAPEHLRGEDAGPSSDLYALGVMLHELATGENPFFAMDAAAVMAAHFQLVPPSIHERNAEISRFLSEVARILLEKEPAKRFASAAEVLDLLEQGESSPWWAARERKLVDEVVRLPEVPVRRETAVHGRAAELAILEEAWKHACDGRGATILLEGEAGIGKTRVVDAFLRGMGNGRAHVLYGSYPPSGGVGGLSNACLDRFGTAGLEDAVGRYLTVTPRLVPAFAALLRREQPPEGSEPVRGDALHAVFVHLMRGLAAEKPLLWAVDDLHFADRDSRRILLSLARAVEGHRVLLLVTTRPGLPEDELAHLSRVETFRRLDLARLAPDEVVALVRDALGSEAVASRLGKKIADKSDGIPFFVFEMLRELKEKEWIRRLDDGSYIETRVIEEVEVPSAVKDLVEGRLRVLNRDEREILDVGAVQGFEFDPGLVARVLERRRIRVLQDLASVERRSAIVRGAGPLYRFDHHQIQEIVYRQLHEGLRAEYHTALAEVLAGDGKQESVSGETAWFLASHHLQGVRPGDGVRYLDQALDHLGKAFRNEAMLALADRALADAGLLQGRQRCEVLLRKAGRLKLLGRWEEERAALEEAQVLADESGAPGARYKVRLQLGQHHLSLARYDEARRVLEEALGMAQQAGDRVGEGSIRSTLGDVCRTLALRDEAREHYERSLALARDAGNRSGEALALTSLGGFCLASGRYDEARRHTEMSLAIAGEIGSRFKEAVARGNLSMVAYSSGRYEEARTHLERSLALYREAGSREGEGIATGNLGAVLEGLGRYDEARAHVRRFLDISREIGDREGEALAFGNLGILDENLGHYAEALRNHERSLALCRRIGSRDEEMRARVNLGAIHAALGDAVGARKILEEAWPLLDEVGNKRQKGYALHASARVAEQEGDLEEAARSYDEALALRREIDYRSGTADTLVALGRLHAAAGRTGEAQERFAEARALGRELDAPDVIALAHALDPGAEVAETERVFETLGERLKHATRCEARFALWRASKDPAHLEEAHRLLRELHESAPPRYRACLIESVPLHRDILKAWEEHGTDAG